MSSLTYLLQLHFYYWWNRKNVLFVWSWSRSVVMWSWRHFKPPRWQQKKTYSTFQKPTSGDLTSRVRANAVNRADSTWAGSRRRRFSLVWTGPKRTETSRVRSSRMCPNRTPHGFTCRRTGTESAHLDELQPQTFRRLWNNHWLIRNLQLNSNASYLYILTGMYACVCTLTVSTRP